jgi:hypothetical protein
VGREIEKRVKLQEEVELEAGSWDTARIGDVRRRPEGAGARVIGTLLALEIGGISRDTGKTITPGPPLIAA